MFLNLLTFYLATPDMEECTSFREPASCSTFNSSNSADFLEEVGDSDLSQSQKTFDDDVKFEKSNNDNMETSADTILASSYNFVTSSVAEPSSNIILPPRKMNKIPWLLTYELPEWPINVAEELNKCISESIPLPSRLRKQIGRIFFQSVSTHAL